MVINLNNRNKNETGLIENLLAEEKLKLKYIYIYIPLFTLGSFIARVLVGPSKQLKQIIRIEHNIIKNPNWPEANQLAIYKHGKGFELGATV